MAMSRKKKDQIMTELHEELRKEQKSRKHDIMIVAVFAVIAIIAATLLAVNLLS